MLKKEIGFSRSFFFFSSTSFASFQGIQYSLCSFAVFSRYNNHQKQQITSSLSPSLNNLVRNRLTFTLSIVFEGRREVFFFFKSHPCCINKHKKKKRCNYQNIFLSLFIFRYLMLYKSAFDFVIQIDIASSLSFIIIIIIIVCVRYQRVNVDKFSKKSNTCCYL